MSNISRLPPRPTDSAGSARPVWDMFIRAFHWSLVILVTIAAVTGFVLGPQFLSAHVLAASAAMVLVVVRVIWGFAGNGYARFSGFVAGPRKTLAYLRALLRGREAHHAGHNPLGAVMVLALLATIVALGLSGWAMLGGNSRIGPLAYLVSYDTAAWLRGWHKLIAIALLVLVALHVAGVIFTARREQVALVRAMITGRKPVRAGDVVPPARRAHTRALAIGAGLVVLGAGVGYLAPQVVPPEGAPVAQIDPVVRAECSDCHALYHPSLLPASDWAHIMDTLDNHFGEDASLDAETTQRIRDWLMAHAADTADTRASHVFRLDPAKGIEKLSDTPFWKRRHASIPASAFQSREVGSRDNCAACHADAESGRFSPLQAETEG